MPHHPAESGTHDKIPSDPTAQIVGQETVQIAGQQIASPLPQNPYLRRHARGVHPRQVNRLTYTGLQIGSPGVDLPAIVKMRKGDMAQLLGLRLPMRSDLPEGT